MCNLGAKEFFREKGLRELQVLVFGEEREEHRACGSGAAESCRTSGRLLGG